MKVHNTIFAYLILKFSIENLINKTVEEWKKQKQKQKWEKWVVSIKGGWGPWQNCFGLDFSGTSQIFLWKPALQENNFHLFLFNIE